VGVTTVAEEKRGRSQFRPAGSRAASDGGALLHAPSLFQHCCCDSRSGSLAISEVLRTVL
jgi:hypothetical protein